MLWLRNAHMWPGVSASSVHAFQRLRMSSMKRLCGLNLLINVKYTYIEYSMCGESEAGDGRMACANMLQ